MQLQVYFLSALILSYVTKSDLVGQSLSKALEEKFGKIIHVSAVRYNSLLHFFF